MPKIAVIPCFNEATVIQSVVQSTLPYVDDVLVVDDGSSDTTAEAAKEVGAKVVRHIKNCGSGAATMTGIEAARMLHADTIVLLDGDGQHDPADIPRLLELLEDSQADIIFTNRFAQKNAIPLIRRIYNGIGNALTFLATGGYVPDSQCGFKVLGPRAVQEIQLQMSGYEFCTEMVYEAKSRHWKIAHCPISVRYSKYTLAKGQSFSSGVKTAVKILLHSLLR